MGFLKAPIGLQARNQDFARREDLNLSFFVQKMCLIEQATEKAAETQAGA